LAGVVLLGPGSTGAVAYLCSMSGGARVSECCCKPSGAHADAHHDDHDPHARLERQGCCALEISEGSRLPATIERAEHAERALVALPGEPPVRAAPIVVAMRLPQSARGPPPRHGPPLFVRNCSFLI
jgi:hypothetical protein